VKQHYFDGTALVEIAQRQSRSDGSLRIALLRVRQVLRRCMEQRLSAEAG
jgi:DNA-directed RNA polymerase specialized sigma24 family protein